MAARDETTNKKRARVDQRITSPTTKGSAAFQPPPQPPSPPPPLTQTRHRQRLPFEGNAWDRLSRAGANPLRFMEGGRAFERRLQISIRGRAEPRWGVGWVEVRGGGEPHTSAVTESRGPSSGRGIDHRAMSPRRLPHSLTFPPSHESHLTPT